MHGGNRRSARLALTGLLAATLLLAAGCGGAGDGDPSGPPGGRGAGARERGEAGGRDRGPGEGAPWGGGGAGPAAVPVEVTAVERRSISSFIETNGTLEAENEVDLVARVSAPVLEIAVEEGMAVRAGQLLARLDDREIRARLGVVEVQLEEADRALRRAEALAEARLVSPEELDVARSRHAGLLAQVASSEIELGYTEITAPFAGRVVTRYVHLAEQVSVNAPLFRLSDFDPLLCPIQVPERELPRLSAGLPGYVQVEAYGDERFAARVLRIRPVVEATTGTVRVTLEVDGAGRLRPGMFARAFVEVETRADALVIPRAALSLASIGDTVFVASDGVAERREVELGFRQGDVVEVLRGLADGERVVSVGQDGLSEGTPIQVLENGGAGSGPVAAGGGSVGPGFDPSSVTDGQKEEMRRRMRDRGLSEAEVEERLSRMAAREGRADQGAGTRGGAGGGPFGPGFDPSRMTDEQKEEARRRMRERGLSDEEIERRLSGERPGGGG